MAVAAELDPGRLRPEIEAYLASQGPLDGIAFRALLVADRLDVACRAPRETELGIVSREDDPSEVVDWLAFAMPAPWGVSREYSEFNLCAMGLDGVDTLVPSGRSQIVDLGDVPLDDAREPADWSQARTDLPVARRTYAVRFARLLPFESDLPPRTQRLRR